MMMPSANQLEALAAALLQQKEIIGRRLQISDSLDDLAPRSVLRPVFRQLLPV